MRSVSATVTSLIAVLALSVVGQPASAAATRRAITITITVREQDAPHRQWVDDAGVLHIRGQHFVDDVSGDLTGTQDSMANINLDLSTGSGNGEASFVMRTDQGDWTGHFSGVIEHYAFSGQLVGQGSGDAEGTRLHGTFTQTGNNPQTFVLTGMILTAGG